MGSVAATVGLAPVAPAAETTLVLGATEFPPYSMVGANGPEGTAVELAQALFEAVGQSIRIEIKPYARALSDAADGTSDGMLLVAETPSRAAELAFTPPLFCEYRSLYARASHRFDWPHEIRGKRIGLIQGYSYGKIVDHWLQRGLIQGVRVPDPQNLIEMQLADRFDAFIMSQSEATLYFAARPAMARDLVRLEPFVSTIPLRLALSLARDGLHRADQISAVIKARGYNVACDDPPDPLAGS